MVGHFSALLACSDITTIPSTSCSNVIWNVSDKCRPRSNPGFAETLTANKINLSLVVSLTSLYPQGQIMLKCVTKCMAAAHWREVHVWETLHWVQVFKPISKRRQISCFIESIWRSVCVLSHVSFLSFGLWFIQGLKIPKHTWQMARQSDQILIRQRLLWL